MRFSITGNVPQGSIEVVAADDPADIRLRLRPDPGSGYMGYYHFRVIGLRGTDCTFRILNAGETEAQRLAGREDVENGWTNTGPVASYDRRLWRRVPAQFDGRVFSFRHRPEHDVCYYASWAPYSLERHEDVLARAQLSTRVRVACVGRSVEGRDIDMLTVGDDRPGRRRCWIYGRQHPSETQTGFFMEGLLERLLDPDDPVVAALLDRAVLHLVPNMNPDGSDRPTTRMNAAGANLNREWVAPDPKRSPEVLHVRALMERLGVDFAMDCHADKELRCNFLGGPLEIPSRSLRLKSLFHGLEDAWAAASPDYERGHPYPGGPPEKADLSMAWNWVAERFDCLSVLLEQPFKDTSWRQDPVHGWSPQRAHRLGATFPTAVLGVVDRLR